LVPAAVPPTPKLTSVVMTVDELFTESVPIHVPTILPTWSSSAVASEVGAKASRAEPMRITAIG
jgi:hypothetical protein